MDNRSEHSLVLVAAAAAWLCGCADRPPESSSAITRDSGGITIVENQTPAWSEADRWRITSEPLLDIGILEGDPGYELHRPRAALRLDDGRIVVSNTGTYQIRFYDEDGRHLRDAGGEGGGPGEFRRISWVGRLEEDSIAVYDQTQRRLSVFSSVGQLVRDVPLRVSGRYYPMIGGRLGDGSLVGEVRIRPRGPDLLEGIGRDSLVLLRFDPAGELIDTVGLFPNRVFDVQNRAIGARTIRGPADVAFSPRAVWAVGEDVVVIGSSDTYELRVLGREGDLRKIVRKAHVPVPITEEDRNGLVDIWLEIHAGRLDNPEVQYFIKTLEDSPLPEAFPAFDPMEMDERGRRIGLPLLLDREGNLWVAQYRRPAEATPLWDIFDPNGYFLGTVTLPEGFLLTDAGADYVLGVWTDELDVARVRMFGLEKGGDGAAVTATAGGASHQEDWIDYTRLHADANGESHFEDVRVQL
ncbi:MAG: hypothetical protein V3T20_01365, partial [Gemmatimonadota bacterium]